MRPHRLVWSIRQGQERDKPQAGHFAKTEAPGRIEVALELDAEGAVAVKAGDRVSGDIFSEARFVDVIGTSKAADLLVSCAGSDLARDQSPHGHMFRSRDSIGRLKLSARACFPASVCLGTWRRAVTGSESSHSRQFDLEENLPHVEASVPGFALYRCSFLYFEARRRRARGPWFLPASGHGSIR